jgi:hypothetical protein
MGQVGDTAYRRLTGDLVKIDRNRAATDRKGKGRAVDDEDENDGDDSRSSDRKQLSTLIDLSQSKGSMLCEEMGQSGSR